MNTNRNSYLLLFSMIAVLLLIVACSPAQATAIRSITAQTATWDDAVMNTLHSPTPSIITPSITPILKTIIPTSTSTPNPPTSTPIPGVCRIRQGPWDQKSGFTFPGTILFTGEKGRGVFSLSGSPPVSYQVLDPSVEFHILGLSQDEDWLAVSGITRDTRGKVNLGIVPITLYSDQGEKKRSNLDLISIKDSSLFSVPWDVKPRDMALRGYWNSHWLSSSNIFSGFYAEEYDCDIRCAPNFIPIVFNPFTGEILIDKTTNMPQWLGSMDFSGDITRVIYEGEHGVYLRDFPSRDRLFLDDGGVAGLIKWSSDDQKVAYTPLEISTRPAKLTIMDREGKNILRIPLPDSIRFLSGIAWSPENDKLVLTAWTQEEAGLILIYDIAKESYQFQCSIPNQNWTGIDPVWSPDGNMIVVGINDLSGHFDILNLENKSIFRSEVSGRPAAWASDPDWGK